MEAPLAGRTGPLSFSSIAGCGGSGSTAATNQAAEPSVQALSCETQLAYLVERQTQL